MAKGVYVQISGRSDTSKAVKLPTSGTLKELKAAVRSAFRPLLDGKEILLTNFTADVKHDEDVRALSDGEKLWAVLSHESEHVVPTKERVSFQPHPNTLTMAGELEYWAAQGRSPLPYALSELIDNALRATRNNTTSRKIMITLVTAGGSMPSAGLISVWDNGCGMSKRELNDWAVMNLSMEDRGEQPQEPDVGHGPTQRNGPERFLSGNLSYFGVGSKNAAFFMGGCTKVVTKNAHSSFVHELSLAAGELEERYRKQQDVYAEDLVHRSPGDASTLTPIETAFQPLVQSWVAAEVDAGAEEAGGSSFTRVMIGQVKPNVLRQIADEPGMQQLCRDLSHLYHYYLHGPQGSRGQRQGDNPGRDDPLPEITIRCITGGRTAWTVNLADITDDMESQYLQAQQAELQFSLMVPGKGVVAGALYYYPFQDERETLPAEGAVASQPEPITTYNMTQQPLASQLPTQAAPPSDGVEAAAEDASSSLWQRSRAPLFSAFWQGRLIPGARIESLPFIEAVRVKRSSAMRDALPDEAFMRLRGSLFFGPAFLVTRNKLTFRDNLQELLASSSPGDRTNLERKFREWLMRCHTTLDKRIRFVGLAEAAMQAAVRSVKGEDVTAFARIEDGSRTVSQGDVVRLNVKPAIMGMVLYFSVQQAVRAEGVYANGSITVRPLPEEVHGTAAERTLPLRRLEGGPVEQREVDECLAKELLKVPSSLRLEPIRLATGNAVELTAGASIPATGVTVLNGSGQHVIRGFLAGDKHSFSIVQRLWRLTPAPGEGNAPAEGAVSPQEEPGLPPKKRKKGSKGRKAAERATPEPAADKAPGTLIIEVPNHTPNKDSFRFERIENGLKLAGSYRLEYELQPQLPGKGLLTITTELIVSPGPLSSFDVQGEGRTLLASREFMLGEHLPSLQLIPRDGCGNRLDSELELLKDVSVEVVTSPTDDNSAPEVIQDLQASFQIGEDAGSTSITGIQVLGCTMGAPTSVFTGSPTPVPGSIPQAQQQQASQQVIAAETVQLRFCVAGLQPQMLPVRLRPGAPTGLRLLPGHPFSDQADEAAAVMTQLPPERAAALVLALASDDALPGFHAQAVDAWGNATGPTDSLPCKVSVECEALSPAQSSFQLPASGRAYVEGLVAASEGPALGRQVPLALSVSCRPADADAEAAVAAAGPAQPLVCALEVEPSTAPAAIVLLHDGQQLPQRELEGEDGESETVFVVEDIAAGAELSELAMQCLDAAGRPVPEGTPGKVRATWIQGTKKLKYGPDGIFSLLNIRIKEDVTEVETYEVKFKSAGPAPVVLEAILLVLKVPAAAHVWQLRLDEAASTQARTQRDGDVDVRSGCPFRLEVEALDKFGNRCPGGEAGLLPPPLLAADSERKLEYDADAWERSWCPQGSGEVLSVNVTLLGRPGLVRMHVRDAAGHAGGSALTPDTLELKLAAGPMTGLAFEGPPALACGMRSVLGALRVIAVDDFGNQTTSPAFEVSLAPSALGGDGSGVAATITVPGGNKVKMKDGEAVFKNVRIEADAPGGYTLRVKSASRKVAGDASIELQLSASNAVKALALRVDSLPAEGCRAGSSVTLCAEVTTEDGALLDADAAAQSLALRLTPPGSGRADEIILSPSEDDGAGPNVFSFATDPLVTAGEWAAVMEYAEQRPELFRALTKREAVLRSTAATFQVVAGPAVALALDSGASGERLAATNGTDARERLLLPGAALQLQDEHGNAAPAAGRRVRLSLHWPPGHEGGGGSELPKLEVDGAAMRKTDERGRAYFGDVGIGEGSGRVAPDENTGANRQGSAMELILVAEVAGLGDADAKQWVQAWTCPVLFSDNAAGFAAAKELTERHAALSAQRDSLQERLSTTGRSAQAAAKELKARTKAVSDCRRPLGRNAPETAEAAEAALSRLQNGAQEADAQQPQMEARFGAPGGRMTEALRRCLALEDAEVVGCVAQLATVQDADLARLLSASYRSIMELLVVKTEATRKRVAQHLAKHKCDVPDMLSMSMCAAFNGKDGDSLGFEGASERARELTAAACHGADAPLAWQLPHTRIMQSQKRGKSGAELGPTDWPQGCLGYAFNLLRPVQLGHRRQLMFSAFNQVLVFETLEEAAKYREFVVQVLRSTMPQVVTLQDLGCITAMGVTKGTSWRVPKLEETHYRFGTTPQPGAASGSGRGEEAAEEEAAALELLLDALRAREEAADRQQAARAEAEATEAECRGELEDLEAQILDLDAQLCSQHPPPGGTRRRAKKRPSVGEAVEIRTTEEVQDVDPEAQPDRRSKRRR